MLFRPRIHVQMQCYSTNKIPNSGADSTSKDQVYWLEPPEMVMTCPLTQPPSSLARKATTLATSSGLAHRPSGQLSAIICSIFAAGMSGVPPGM